MPEPKYGEFIDSAGDGDQEVNSKSLPYAEDTEAKAISKVAKLILAATGDESIDSTEEAGRFFTQVIQTFALLDQMAPEFIELVEEHHLKPFGPRENCHLCKLHAAAQEYLDGRQ